MQMTRPQELEYMMQLSELQKMMVKHLMKYNSMTLDEYLGFCKKSIDKTDIFKDFISNIVKEIHNLGDE